MATTHQDSYVKTMIKNLCHSFGWSYGVLWSFQQPNSIYSTMQDAYFEDEVNSLIDDVLLQSPILGGGLIGQAAFTKKHLWMSSEDNYIGPSSSGSIWDMFQDDSKLYGQFSLGIKTIAAIPVEPQGVLQFGSTNKIPENMDFVNQTKTMFNEVVNGNGNLPTISSSSLSGVFGSLIPPQDTFFGTNTSLGFPPQSQSMFLDNNTNNDNNNNQSASNLLANTGSSLTSLEPYVDTFNLPTDFGIMDELFQTGDHFDMSQWYPQSPIQSNVTLNDQIPFGFNEKVKPLTFSGIDVDVFGSTGDLVDIVMPALNDNRLSSLSKLTQSIKNDYTNLPPKKGLFSNLGIKELFEGISGTSTSCVEDQVSSGSKRRKTENSLWEMGSLQLHPGVHNKNLMQKSEPIFKSEPWLGDGYSMDGSSTILQGKKQVEPTKPAKKKAKPGTRPRPKDRQMILDRMAELRELIPNGEKMSIDCLLDRTIKHMLFLQSVTKHADRIKQVDEPKYNGIIQNNYSNDPNKSGVTWACELGNQMICPIRVENLSTPGQMLIEMICDQHGFFLEIVDVIRGFGLTILKGVMEAREEKIWARFIVEAEAKTHVTWLELIGALVKLLQTMGCNDNHLDKKIMQTGNSVMNDFHCSGIQLPVSLADTGYGMNLL
ncbi:transcription factor bHLH157-like [Bidens hawaiensis]|uniref:transcription factor bHLH157-like n=1 Tax=Bidens hawaiensis TaxID=980011 RepID=UPI004049AC01